MANDLNQCNFIGRLGNDPEVRYLPNGDAVANISIAVGESWKDKQGQKQERTEWIRVVAFRKLGEIIGEYLRKGSKVYISGKMVTRKWTDKEGVERYSTEIVGSEMQMLDSRAASQGGDYAAPDDHAQSAPRAASAAPAASSGAPAAAPTADTGNFDDDIPF